MGTLNFLLPSDASQADNSDLILASMTGGYDNMPAPTRVAVHADRFAVERDIAESGSLLVPWNVQSGGRIICSSGTLMERRAPYSTGIELARGKLNQLRGQAADWRMAGLQIPDSIDAQVRDANRRLGHAVTSPSGTDVDVDARVALASACHTANQLVRVYIDQMLRARHQRQARLETGLGVRLNGVPTPNAAVAIAAASNAAAVPLTWRLIEPSESQYRWDQADAMLEWASKQNLKVSAGPLVDFSKFGLPDWLSTWEGDLPSLSSFMCDYVETVVGRYHRRIRRWQLTAASNTARVLKLSEDDLLWLTARLAEAAWQVDPEIELSVGLAQPWGDYLAREERTYSPFVFADTLVRAGLRMACLDVEWIMGVSPRGSYCRDLLDASRMLDMYALLGIPLQVTMSYPASPGADALADPEMTAKAGHWIGGLTAEVQADWAADFLALAACKPFVRTIYWAHLNDAEAHQFPHSGLLDYAAEPRPALDELQHLRDEHLI